MNEKWDFGVVFEFDGLDEWMCTAAIKPSSPLSPQVLVRAFHGASSSQAQLSLLRSRQTRKTPDVLHLLTTAGNSNVTFTATAAIFSQDDEEEMTERFFKLQVLLRPRRSLS